MTSLGWALIQYDWCPYKKGEISDTEIEMHTEKTPCKDWNAAPSQGATKIQEKGLLWILLQHLQREHGSVDMP